jgi:TM2 domain-containing membrane protein YozV
MKTRYAKYTSQSVATLSRYFFLLLVVGLGACQRSTYSFQRVAEPEHPAVAVVPDSSSAVIVAPAQQPVSAVSPVVPARHQAKRRVRLAPAPMRRIQSLMTMRSAVQAVRTQTTARSQQDPLPSQAPERGRSRGIAFLLAVLLGAFGVHLFYLGYHGRGIAYLAAVAAAFLLLVLAGVGLLASTYGGGGGFVALALAAGIISVVVNALSLIDAVMILTNNLRPKNGEYYPRFFQTRP